MRGERDAWLGSFTRQWHYSFLASFAFAALAFGCFCDNNHATKSAHSGGVNSSLKLPGMNEIFSDVRFEISFFEISFSFPVDSNSHSASSLSSRNNPVMTMPSFVFTEMGWKPSSFPPRWVDVVTHERRIRALTFCIDRKSGRYVSGLSEPEIAVSLARAVGSRGTMAEYLLNTVTHLEELGIHDPHLWRLQELVAAQIETEFGPAG